MIGLSGPGPGTPPTFYKLPDILGDEIHGLGAYRTKKNTFFHLPTATNCQTLAEPSELPFAWKILLRATASNPTSTPLSVAPNLHRYSPTILYGFSPSLVC